MSATPHTSLADVDAKLAETGHYLDATMLAGAPADEGASA